MAIVSVFYATLGYLALLGAILWGMLFVGAGGFPNIAAPAAAAPQQAAFVDVGLLLLLALLHRWVSAALLRRFARRSMPRGLERSTQAWAAAVTLVVLYACWQPLPQVLWSAPASVQSALSALFYLAWTLIMIGAFVASQPELFEIAAGTRAAPRASLYRQPLYWGILLAVWALPVMTVGHLLLASVASAYVLFDGLWALRAGVARSSAAPSHSSASASRVSALSGPSEAVSDTAA